MPNKKFWDNSSLQGNVHWDNQTLPGLTDEELFNTNWNQRKTKSVRDKLRMANTLAAQRPDVKSKNEQGQNKRKASGWSKKLIGNKNGSGKRTKKIVQPESANKARSEKLKGRKIPSITGVPKPKVICPHCGKEGGRPQMIQYHFDKCKHK